MDIRTFYVTQHREKPTALGSCILSPRVHETHGLTDSHMQCVGKEQSIPAVNIIIIIIIRLMTKEAGVAYMSIKHALCILKAKYTNLANEFTTITGSAELVWLLRPW